MLRGKFWITPEGVFDVSIGEHKIFARTKMLGLEPGGVDYPQARSDFTWIPRDHDIASLLKRPCLVPGAVAFIRRGGDEREFVMCELGWVRTTKSAFYAWVLDQKTLDLIRGARDFWKVHQDMWAPWSVATFIETSCWKEGDIPVIYLAADGCERPAMQLRHEYIKCSWREDK